MRKLVVIGALLVGLIVGALVLREGWELPVRMYCSGDVCLARSWFDVDWARVNWALEPTRIACFEPNPSPHSVIIGPGDECVRSHGDVIERRATYGQLREDIRDRRVGSLIAATTVVLTAPLAASAALRLRRRSSH